MPINSLDDFHVLFDEIPIEKMNTSMTINGTAMWLLALYVALARERGVDIVAADRHHPERPDQGVPGPRDLHLPARAEPADHRRDVRVLPGGDPRWNASNICSYHLQEAARDADPGARLRPGQRHQPPRPARGARPLRRRPVRAGRRAHLLLRERRHPLRRGDVQDARLRRAVGRVHPRPLRRHRPEVPPLPLRRAGQLAGPHRGAAREQRLAHPDRGPRRHPEP